MNQIRRPYQTEQDLLTSALKKAFESDINPSEGFEPLLAAIAQKLGNGRRDDHGSGSTA